MTKICSKCKIDKNDLEFEYCNHTTTNLSAWCKKCISNHKAEKYQLKKEKYKKQSKLYYTNNKIKKSEYVKKYQQQNKEKLNKYRNEYSKQRKNTDINYRLGFILRGRLLDALKRSNITKRHSVMKLIGCTIEEYKQYIEQQLKPEMNWDNHGEVWEIDHIKPCSLFNLTDIEQQKQCFHYTNTKPLFKTSFIAESFGYNEIGNRNKSNNYD
jgi:hypothetical protein